MLDDVESICLGPLTAKLKFVVYVQNICADFILIKIVAKYSIFQIYNIFVSVLFQRTLNQAL